MALGSLSLGGKRALITGAGVHGITRYLAPRFARSGVTINWSVW